MCYHFGSTFFWGGNSVKKLKIFLYPFLFSLSFLFFYTVPIYIVAEMCDSDGYGGLVFALLFILAWVCLVLPFYCIRYSKLLAEAVYFTGIFVLSANKRTVQQN